MFYKLLQNHTLTNLTFFLVLALGWLSYYQLPREQDPSINFNWVQIWAYWPGATAPDIEARVTEPLEEGIKKVPDVKFVSSTSREGVSSILVRFSDMDEDQFDKRMTDLRRELQARQSDLPDTVKQPDIFVISSSKAFPTATLVVYGQSGEEVMHDTAKNVKDDLSRMKGIDDVLSVGDRDAELQVDFLPHRLLGLGISAVDLADTVRAYFKDLAAGDLQIGDQKWLIRLSGTSSDPEYIGSFPIASGHGEVLLRNIADITRGREKARELVRFKGQPAVLLLVYKKGKVNNLELLEKVDAYIHQKNQLAQRTGVHLALLDDQTESTRAALSVMERNALIGLLLVLLATWAFLGFKIAMFTSLGITFVLAGTFWALSLVGETLNISVLLGVVISLGMLVDDAVVVVEAIYYRMRQGVDALSSVTAALQEVGPAVTTAVLTTIAAFLPLMLLPGVLGDFMRVVPFVVSVALIISLIEAFWILPSHIVELKPNLSSRHRVQLLRNKATRRLRHFYTVLLIRLLRRPKQGLYALLILLASISLILFSGGVRIDFFAADYYRLFYVNVEMQPGTTLEKTSSTLDEIQTVIEEALQADEARGVVNYVGQQFTDKEVLSGDNRGQILVSLKPLGSGGRDVQAVIDSVSEAVSDIPGPINVSYLKRKMGPPTSKAISIKVRGDDIVEIRRAVSTLRAILEQTPGVADIYDDDSAGGMELQLQLNPDAITRAELDPVEVVRAVHLYAAGEIVANTQYMGDRLNVRVRAKPQAIQDIDTFMNNSIGLSDGGGIALSELLTYKERSTVSNIRHQDFRRAITLEANLDTAISNTLLANRQIEQQWQAFSRQFPGVNLDFSGEMDDVEESLGAMVALFILGIGLVYLVLGTQFNSYIQPLIVLTVVPLAFIGVVLGLFISGNPLSLFTLYGVVALGGIAANDAIVLISTINGKLTTNTPVATAVAYAARRRVVPIMITSITTIAGLFSLAVGLGGKSLIWSPVATTIVWGLTFSTLLSLFVIPLAYIVCIKTSVKQYTMLGALDTSLGVYGQMLYRIKVILGFSDRQDDPVLAVALNNVEHKQLYDSGILAWREGDSFSAIKCFENLSDEYKNSSTLNLFAAQALIRYMEENGWDVGYMPRARRYLIRARQSGADYHTLDILEKACDALDEDRV
ncbi:hypothetical protein A9Q89_04495 [Gammaproteobacteria bacterium 53_120_T64]|nr:hypothetical protein A9Q89_04495 [Gammaproteobacteria bacterium 53_120_T64]